MNNNTITSAIDTSAIDTSDKSVMILTDNKGSIFYQIDPEDIKGTDEVFNITISGRNYTFIRFNSVKENPNPSS